MKIELSLPPSTNRRLIKSRRTGFFILSQEARNWLEEATWLIKTKWKKPPIDDFFFLDLDFFLKDKRSDSHNYKKLICDAIERGGICTNDKYIMDRTVSVQYDSKNPRVIVSLP